MGISREIFYNTNRIVHLPMDFYYPGKAKTGDAPPRKGFEGKRVISWKQKGEHEFEGEVAGSEKEPYHVVIDTEHPRKSTCNCPHAEGKKIVCKRKIALFFTVFPKEADRL